jgi:hypothetical protein
MLGDVCAGKFGCEAEVTDRVRLLTTLILIVYFAIIIIVGSAANGIGFFETTK